MAGRMILRNGKISEKKYNAHIVILSGPGDIGLGEAIGRQLPREHFSNQCVKLELLETVEFLRHSRLIIANSNGTIDLAAASGVSWSKTTTRSTASSAVDQRLLGPGIDLLQQFPVGAQEVGRVVLGHEADFARGRACGIHYEMGFDRRLGGERAHEHAAGFIFADHADKDAADAKRSNVAGYVACTADHEIVACNGQDRRRRFGRYTRDIIRSRRVSDLRRGVRSVWT